MTRLLFPGLTVAVTLLFAVSMLTGPAGFGLRESPVGAGQRTGRNR